MAKHKTALGRTIDMSELMARNEKTRAVGNMRVNARGDTIDANGKIVEPVTNKVNERYSKTVGNRAAQPVRQVKPRRPGSDTPGPRKQTLAPQQHSTPQTPKPELTEYEKQLEEDLADDFDIEEIKAKERN